MVNFIRVLGVIFVFAVLTACGGGGMSAAAIPCDNPDFPPAGARCIDTGDNRGFSGVVITSSATPDVQIALRGRPDQWAVPVNGFWHSNIMSMTISGMMATAFAINNTSWVAIKHKEAGVVATLGVSVPIILGSITFVQISVGGTAALLPISFATAFINNLAPTISYTAITTDYQGQSFAVSYPVRRVAPDTALEAAPDADNRLILTCAPENEEYCFGWHYGGDNRQAAVMLGKIRLDLLRLPTNLGGYANTYRIGYTPYKSDNGLLFVGFDTYNNAIFTIDAKGENLHRFGFAIGDGYAVRYEIRLNL